MTRASLALLAGIAAAVVCSCDRSASDSNESGRGDTATAPAGGTIVADSTMPAIDQVSPFAADSIPIRTSDGKPARYGVRSGRIKYKFVGVAEGERTVTFDQYGMRERREEKFAPAEGGPGMGRHTIMIVTPESFGILDLIDKKGWKDVNRNVERYLASDSSKRYSFGEMSLLKSGAKRLPDTTIEGKTTRVMQMIMPQSLNTIWIWKGIAIREQMYSTQNNTGFSIVPISIETDIEVPESTFEFPKGYTITDGPQPAPGTAPGQSIPVPAPGGPPQGMPPGAPPQGMPPGAPPGMPPGMPPAGPRR